jgi:crooked neck
MEGATEEEVFSQVQRARALFVRAYGVLKQQGLKEERVLLLEAWREAESNFNHPWGDVSTVEAKLPRKIKMRRMATAEDGSDLGWEEYYDYTFPDDEKKIAGLKILEQAMKWKQAAAAAAAAAAASASGAGDGAGDEDAAVFGGAFTSSSSSSSSSSSLEQSTLLGKRKAAAAEGEGGTDNEDDLVGGTATATATAAGSKRSAEEIDIDDD